MTAALTTRVTELAREAKKLAPAVLAGAEKLGLDYRLKNPERVLVRLKVEATGTYV